MAKLQTMSKMYLAIIIEDSEDGMHREALWFGSTPENLGLMIMDMMKDWYDGNEAGMDRSIIKYHKMLEDKDKLTFQKMSGEAFNANGKRIVVDLTNDLNVMFNFIVNEICSIFAKNGESVTDFRSLAQFRQHFIDRYEIDEDFQKVLSAVNEATISKALFVIDMKYDFYSRHYTEPEEK